MKDGACSTVKVWDAFVRIAHWSLVGSVTAAWLTRHSDSAWHEWLGYMALAIVVCRVVWGFVGSPYARFSGFVRTPAATVTYAHALIARGEQRFIGHNPLGGWMIVALLATVTLLGLTGWLGTTDAYWGVAWVAESHDALSNLLVGLIALHVAGVAFSSWRHQENLAKAMITGRKQMIEERSANQRGPNAPNQRN
ncbi:MAG: cytochrome b/b6 domain-containing protein [Burkholderiales bacterium]